MTIGDMLDDRVGQKRLDLVLDGTNKSMSVFYKDGKHSRAGRKVEKPYLRVKGFLFGMESDTLVLKCNKEDSTAQYASAFCVVKTAATGSFGDMGDTYWTQVYSGQLVEVDGREPTQYELDEWTFLRMNAESGAF